MVPAELLYTEEHEWVRVEGNMAIVGITSYATHELGEIVFVELPAMNVELSQMDEFGSVESVKTVSSLYVPVSGKVVEINKSLEEHPDMVNDSPYEDGWICKVKIADELELDSLMTADDYKQYLETL